MDENPNTFNFQQFGSDIDAFAIVISAERRAGKSHLATDLIYQICLTKSFELCILFSETAALSCDFGFVPKMFIYDEFNDEVLEKYIELQTSIIKELKNKGKDKSTYPKLLFIFDDVISDLKVFYSKAINKLFTTGRHLGISFVFITQYLHALSPRQRGNIDLLITFKNANDLNKKSLIQNFITLQYHKSEIENYISKCTFEKHRAMIICKYKFQDCETLEDYIYTYKSPPEISQFKLCSKEYWDDNTPHLLKSNKKHSLDLTQTELTKLTKAERKKRLF